MSLLSFLLGAIIISLSGVMAPGPLTTVTLGEGAKTPHAGAFIAFGHGLVEFPLMVAIFYGFGYFIDIYIVKTGIFLVGGVFLLIMAVGMFQSIKSVEVGYSGTNRSPLSAGVALSLGNPYFIIWWATVGASLAMSSVRFGLIGFVLFALVHWLCDFFWLYFLSALSFKGGQFFGKIFQKVVFAVCGVFLLFFSLKFILSGLGF